MTLHSHFASDFQCFLSLICRDFGKTPFTQITLPWKIAVHNLKEWMGGAKKENPVVIGHSLGGLISVGTLELKMGKSN